jgi:hypothetical protein
MSKYLQQKKEQELFISQPTLKLLYSKMKVSLKSKMTLAHS